MPSRTSSDPTPRRRGRRAAPPAAAELLIQLLGLDQSEADESVAETVLVALHRLDREVELFALELAVRDEYSPRLSSPMLEAT